MVKVLRICDVTGRRRKGVRFHIRLETVTSRWPSQIRAGAQFSMPTMG